MNRRDVLLHRLRELTTEITTEEAQVQHLSEQLSTALDNLKRARETKDAKTEAQVKHLEFRTVKLVDQNVNEECEIKDMHQQVGILEWELHCTFKEQNNIKKKKALRDQSDRQQYGIGVNEPEEVANARRRMWTGSFWNFLDSEYSKGAPRYDARSRKVKELMEKSTSTKVISAVVNDHEFDL